MIISIPVILIVKLNLINTTQITFQKDIIGLSVILDNIKFFQQSLKGITHFCQFLIMFPYTTHLA